MSARSLICKALICALTLFPAAAHATDCTLDGTNHGHLTASASPTTATLTTTSTNTIVCLYVTSINVTSSANVTSITGGSITFTNRFSHGESGLLGGAWFGRGELWCGLSAATQTGTAFTVNYDKVIVEGEVALFGVNGVTSTASPFDANGSLSGYAHNVTGSSTTAQVTGISTTSADDFLIAICTQWASGTGCNVNAGGWTNVTVFSQNSDINLKVQYKTVNAAQSSVTIPTLGTSIANWSGEADAFACGAVVTQPIIFHAPW